MNTLLPSLAVRLAEFAYDSISVVSRNAMKIEPDRIISKHFVFNAKKSAFTGVSGTVAEHVLNQSTGFGFFGIGSNEGNHKGEVVLTFRGTAGCWL